MPRISAPTVAENRAQRRGALLAAGSSLLIRHGTFTMADVAAEVGLSRSAVYEYYANTAELVTDVVDSSWAQAADVLMAATARSAEPVDRIEAWVRAALGPQGAKRRALQRRAGLNGAPPAALRPLRDALADLHCPDPDSVAEMAAAVVDVALDRVAAGEADGDATAEQVVGFVLGGVLRLAPVSPVAHPTTHP